MTGSTAAPCGSALVRRAPARYLCPSDAAASAPHGMTASPAPAWKASSSADDLSATLIDLAGSIALLLWGAHMVQTGVTEPLAPGCGAS